MNSLRSPFTMAEDQFRFGVNLTVRGGLAQTRPGQAQRLSLPPGNLQGGAFFNANKQAVSATTSTSSGATISYAATIYNYDGTTSNKSELDYLVFAVDGNIYFAPFPLEQPKDWEKFRLQDIQLDPTQQEVVFKLATKSATTSSGINSSTQITPSYNIIVVQDGINQPVYWDGSNTSGAVATTMPVGYWMEYSGNRLWVASGNIVIASDLADPLGWTEWQTGAGRGSFSFPRPITGMQGYVSQNNNEAMMVFTDRKTEMLQSGILDRTQWATTSNFQSVLYPTVGCIAGKSLAFQAGMLWWYSLGGLVSADVAAAAYLSSQVLYKDSEMNRIKAMTPADVTSICGASFENYLLFSIPYLENLPSETMVLDYAPASEWNEGRIPAWCGVWNGTRPIEWASGIINNQHRLFHFSVDYAPCNNGSYNSVWENFLPTQYDSYLRINPDGSTTTRNNRIYCQMETSILGDGFDPKELDYGEIYCSQVSATVDVQVSYRGCKGAYIPILNTRLMAITDDYQYDKTPFLDQISQYGILRSQYRKLVTQSVNRDSRVASCESKYAANIDRGFSFLIEWCGEMGLDAVKMYINPWSDKSHGSPQKPETVPCLVQEDGNSMLLPDLPQSPYDGNEPAAQTSFTAQSSQTATSTCATFAATITATATASYLSYISYTDAYNQASQKALLAAQQAVSVARANSPC